MVGCCPVATGTQAVRRVVGQRLKHETSVNTHPANSQCDWCTCGRMENALEGLHERAPGVVGAHMAVSKLSTGHPYDMILLAEIKPGL